jgi:hypothetical protein
MAGMLGALIQKLVEAIVGKAVDATVERASTRFFRRLAWVVALGTATWVAVASALLWESARVHGVTGLWQYVPAGGPSWELATPIVAALTVVILLAPVSGRHLLTLVFAVATFFLVLASLAEFQGGSGYGLNGPALLSGIAVLFLALAGLMLGLSDRPSLDAPWARLSLMYFGRLKYLRTLRQYGRDRGWQVSGPVGRYAMLTVQGRYDGEHAVSATSSANSRPVAESNGSYSLVTRMSSPRDIVAVRIGFERPPKRLPAGAIRGETRGAPGGKPPPPLYFYLFPEPGIPVPDAFLPRMVSAVEAGRPFMRRHDFVQATPFGIRFTHMSYYVGFRAREANLDAMLRWMRELIGVLEPISPAGPAAAGGRAAASGQVLQ